MPCIVSNLVSNLHISPEASRALIPFLNAATSSSSKQTIPPPPPLLVLIHTDPNVTDTIGLKVATYLRESGFTAVRSVCPATRAESSPQLIHAHPHIIQACRNTTVVNAMDRKLFVVNL